MNRALLVAALLVIDGCSRETQPGTRSSPPSATASAPEEARWLLAGETDERFVRVAAHLRGFDMAMVETAYRYGELYWAGRDRNWGYAAYQLGKIETAIARGVERRPRRAASALMLDGAVLGVRRAIGGRDAAVFDAAFAVLTATCNACHQAERVPFIRVEPPSVRTTSTGPLPADGGVQ